MFHKDIKDRLKWLEYNYKGLLTDYWKLRGDLEMLVESLGYTKVEVPPKVGYRKKVV